MTIEAFGQLAAVLEILPPQFDQKWDADSRRVYFQLLQVIPDGDVGAVAQAVGSKLARRPAPAAILELWREITQPPKLTADVAMGLLLDAISTPRYEKRIEQKPGWVFEEGFEFQRFIWRRHHKAHERAWANRVARNGVECKQPRRSPRARRAYVPTECEVRVYGYPPEIAKDAVLSAVVRNMGGWENLSSGPGCDTPKNIWLAQLRKMCEMVIAGQPDDALKQIRADYLDQQRVRIELAGRMLEGGYEGGDE